MQMDFKNDQTYEPVRRFFDTVFTYFVSVANSDKGIVRSK